MPPKSKKSRSTGRSSRSSVGSREQDRPRANDQKEFTSSLPSLAVRGCSVPVHLQQKKSPKEGSASNRPKFKKKDERTGSTFPVDKIIYLAEKLALSETNSNKIELVTSSMEIVNRRCEEEKPIDAGFNRLLVSHDDLFCSRTFFSAEKSRGRNSKEILSAELDFTLDISSLSNGSDESSTDCEESFCGEGRSNSAFREEGPHFDSEAGIPASRTPHRVNCCFCEGKISGFGFGSESHPSTSTESEDRFGLAVCEREENQRMERNSLNDAARDVICLYVNSLENQKNLTKYFSPCRVCQKTCCACLFEGGCPTSTPSESSVVVGETISGNLEQFPSFCGKVKESRAFANCSRCCRSIEHCRDSSRPPSDSQNQNDLVLRSCGCNGCVIQESNWSENPMDRISKSCATSDPEETASYASCLANAARSARNLADDLESVLSTFRKGIESLPCSKRCD